MITLTNIHEACVEAVNLMVEAGVKSHTSFISAEDSIRFGLKSGGRIPKVTIEWVDESEASAKMFTDAQIDELDEIAESLGE